MFLRKSIQKTKNCFKKTIRNLKAFFAGTQYRNLSGTPLLSPFSCVSGCSAEALRTDEYYYKDLCKEWETRLGDTKKRGKSMALALAGEPSMEETSLTGAGRDTPRQEKMPRAWGSEDLDQNVNSLGKKMRELEITDAGDLEHVLDVEEALHYYSLLRSPVYLDMVDRFFTDMYSDLTVAQGAVRSSRKRFGSRRLRK